MPFFVYFYLGGERVKIPEKVIVAGVEYSVAHLDVIVVDGETDYAGSCSDEFSQICLLNHLVETKKEQIFIHELLHACFYEAGYMDHEEELVNRVGRVLYQVLKDNRLYFGPGEGGDS